ncbi:hypothetical protein D3C71_2172600 [compost metagenome]
MSRLLSLRRFTSDRIDTPAAATEPNITIMAPPKTALGITVVNAASLGSSPSTTIIAPAAKITLRVFTRVKVMRPTF